MSLFFAYPLDLSLPDDKSHIFLRCSPCHVTGKVAIPPCTESFHEALTLLDKVVKIFHLR